jgi:PiT family inorganic phosphate transporter
MPLLPTLVAAADPLTPAHPATGGMLAVIFGMILVALVFDFLNGFHDAANSIATIVSTRVLTPTQAVIWAAFFNFVAAFLFGTNVAKTIAGDLVNNEMIDIYVVAGGLLGAIIWNVITWLLALPTSSSHALVGGIGGAAVLKSGMHVLKPEGWGLILLGIFLAPILGFIFGSANMIIVSWLARRQTPHRVDKLFRRLQLLSAALYSLGHGGNDAQKTMGIIVMVLSAGAGKYAHWAHADPNSWLNRMHLLGAEHNVAWWIIHT